MVDRRTAEDNLVFLQRKLTKEESYLLKASKSILFPFSSQESSWKWMGIYLLLFLSYSLSISLISPFVSFIIFFFLSFFFIISFFLFLFSTTFSLISPRFSFVSFFKNLFSLMRYFLFVIWPRIRDWNGKKEDIYGILTCVG